MEREKLVIVKIGGTLIDSQDDLRSFLSAFASLPVLKILVHGGGKMATELAGQLGIKQTMIDGRRITDEATLRIITMVYSGYINKHIAAILQSMHCNAMGLSGTDGSLIKAHKRAGASHDYGFAGDVDSVNDNLIDLLLKQCYTPVIAPLTHDGHSQLLNTNADTIATEIAVAMCARYNVHLLYCFEKNGVLQDAIDESSIISHITPASFEELKSCKAVHSGMLPKLENAFAAIGHGVQDVTIGHSGQLKEMYDHYSGTKILKS